MKHYKIRLERIFILLLLIAIILTIVSIICVHLFKKPKNNVKKLTIDNYKENLNFKGTYIKENQIYDNYVSVMYNENGKEIGYLVNLNTGKIEDIKDIIIAKKSNDFDSKILELLKLKYPSKIANLLMKTTKNYYFDANELYIYYDKPNDLNTERIFSLKINYNEINKYLKIKINATNEYENETGFIYDKNKITIALTFDDGPAGSKTESLIDALEDYKMSATFFMIGNKLSKFPDSVKKVYNSHSEVGYHSYAHTKLTSQDSKTISDEFNITNKTFNSITGGYLKLTRPPYGNYNKEVLNAIDNAFIRWNIDTNDWKYKDVDYLYNYVLENLQDRSIILFHDTYQTSVDAAIKLIEELYLRDIQVLSISNIANLTETELTNHEVYFNFK